MVLLVIGRDDRFPVLTIWLLIVLGGVQLVVWLSLGVPRDYAGLLPAAICWLTLLLLAALVTRRGIAVQRRLTQDAVTQQATLQHVAALELRVEVLETLGHAVDVPQAFQALTRHIERVASCDRLGLALLSDDQHEFHTFTARTVGADPPVRPRPAMVFRVDGTALGQVVRTGQPVLLDDTRNPAAAAYLDAIVLSGSGFYSALLVPLSSGGRAVGTLNLVCRRAGAFTLAQASSVAWIAEILADAWVAQQTQVALGRLHALESISERTLALAAETNSALQAIIGHCDLIRREYNDERLRRDIDTVMRQAERIAQLLARMRGITQDRLQEISAIRNRDDRVGVDRT